MAGFGSGLIAVPLLSLVSPVTAVVPLVVSLDYLGSASQGIKNLGQIAWREQLALVPFMLVGVGLGLYLLQAVPTAALARGLGAFVLVYAVYRVIPLTALPGSPRFAIVCGLLAGLVGALCGSGRPACGARLTTGSLRAAGFPRYGPRTRRRGARRMCGDRRG